jgi:cholesterol transport system auxiliary component
MENKMKNECFKKSFLTAHAAVASTAVSSPLSTARAAALAAIFATVLVTGCGVGPKPKEAVGAYDFGLPAAARPVALKSLNHATVVAPNWMDSTSLYYRLAYANAARPAAYAQTRWVSTPAHLVEARLKERAVAGGVLLGAAGPGLRIEIDEFTQVFDAEKSSRAVLRARASLSGARDVMAQKAFVIELPATTPDGPGGAAALGSAANALVDDVLAWAATAGAAR